MKYKNNAALWVKKDKSGKAYFSFKADRDIKAGESFNFFKNDKGGVETRPDYKSYEKIEDTNDIVTEPTSESVAEDLPF